MTRGHLKTVLVAVGALVSAVVLRAPALSLLLGVCYGLLDLNFDPTRIKKIQTQLLSLSVVCLGAGLNFTSAIRVGSQGVLLTAGLLTSVFLLGYLLSRWLKVPRDEAVLISVGTGICGGSAIAAVASVLRPKDSALALSLAIVFLLNGLALIVLPPLGHWLGLSQSSFGWWSALAIHDTSSVVGAAMQYGREALEIGTTAKLARALWIIPVTLIVSLWFRKEAKQRLNIPWFIPAFLVASAIFSYFPGLSAAREIVVMFARRGFVLVLFFVGLGISKKSLRELRPTVGLMGVLLWLFSLLASYVPARVLGQ